MLPHQTDDLLTVNRTTILVSVSTQGGIHDQSERLPAADGRRGRGESHRGDRDAVAGLIADLQPAVIRYCRARLGSGDARHSVDDVAQDVLLAVLAALPGYSGPAQSLRAFVFGIARHKIADVSRARQRERARAVETLPDTSDPSPGPEELVARGETQVDLRRAFGRPDRQSAGGARAALDRRLVNRRDR